MFNIGPMEILVIAAIALLFVGPKRLPEVGKTIGRTLREFKKAQEDFTRHFNLDDDEHNQAPSFPEPQPTEMTSLIQPSPESSDEPDESLPVEPD